MRRDNYLGRDNVENIEELLQLNGCTLRWGCDLALETCSFKIGRKVLTHIERDRLQAGLNTSNLSSATHLSLEVCALLFSEMACMHFKPAINLVLVGVRDDFAAFV